MNGLEICVTRLLEFKNFWSPRFWIGKHCCETLNMRSASVERNLLTVEWRNNHPWYWGWWISASGRWVVLKALSREISHEEKARNEKNQANRFQLTKKTNIKIFPE